MSSLRDRLARFDRSARQVTAERPGERRYDWALPLGLTLCGEGLAAHLVRRVELPALAGLDAASWFRLSGAAVTPKLPWAILDTETTGLESGTGTLVFVTAVLRLDAGEAELIQRFLIEPAGEAAFLHAFCRDLDGVGALLSYNGKSFDLPRLRSRLRLHRLPAAFLDGPHLDLMHLCRALTADWLADARLCTVERHLLGEERPDDLPGAEVPAIYRRWLQDGDATCLGRVLLHNRRDVENLHALAQRLAGILARPIEQDLPPVVTLAAGRVLERRGLWGEAEACFRAALASGAPAAPGRIVLRLARLARRRGDFETAGRLWQSIAGPTPDGILARIELAKLYEHRRRDLPAAAAQTQAALDELSDSPRCGELLPLLQRRLARIARKSPAALWDSA
jgi:uncharacterized protein YprB with RNaseH-like and TPR domain